MSGGSEATEKPKTSVLFDHQNDVLSVLFDQAQDMYLNLQQ